MHDGAPPEAGSKDRSSGPSSSQLGEPAALRRGRRRLGEVRGEERVGQLAGDGRLRDDAALVRAGAGASVSAGSGLGGGLQSGGRRSSRSTERVPSAIAASSVSSESSEESRAAVRASTVAIALIALELRVAPRLAQIFALTRARSSRTSSATAWKVPRMGRGDPAALTAISTVRAAFSSAAIGRSSGRCLWGAERPPSERRLARGGTYHSS